MSRTTDSTPPLTTGPTSQFVKELSNKPTADEVLLSLLKYLLEKKNTNGNAHSLTATEALKNFRDSVSAEDRAALFASFEDDALDEAAARLDSAQQKRILKKDELLTELRKQGVVLKKLGEDFQDEIQKVDQEIQSVKQQLANKPNDKELIDRIEDLEKRLEVLKHAESETDPYKVLSKLRDQEGWLKKINLNPALAPKTVGILNATEGLIKRLKRDYGTFATINRRIEKLETVAKLIDQDITTLNTAAGVNTMTPTEETSHKGRVNQLEKARDEVKASIKTLREQKAEYLPHVGNVSSKESMVRDRTLNAVSTSRKMESSAHQKMSAFKPASIEALEKICAAHNNSNPELNALRDNTKALNGAMSLLQKVTAKMVSPEAIKAYKAEYTRALQNVEFYRTTLCARLNDPTGQTLINQAVRDTGKTDQEKADNQKKLFELTRDLEVVNALAQDLVLKSKPVSERLSFKKESIPPLGHDPEPFFSFRKGKTKGKTNDKLDSECTILKWDRDAKTGKWTQSIVLDSKGNPLQPTLKEIHKVISEMNAERKIQAGKTGQPYVPITLEKDLFGKKGYTANCFNGKEDENTTERQKFLERLEMEIANRKKPVSAQVEEVTSAKGATVAETVPAASNGTVTDPKGRVADPGVSQPSTRPNSPVHSGSTPGS
jgi:hypothetical protein